MRLRSLIPGTILGLSAVSAIKLFVAAGLVTSMSGCCGWNPFGTKLEPDVRETFFAAMRNPESFDSQIASLNIPDGAPACLRELADQAFEMEVEQILSCDAYLTGSVSWNQCHEEAEQMHNQGVILGDIARAIEGTRTFQSSSGGNYLILTKTLITNEFGAGFYNAFIDELARYTPNMQCDLGCA